jgi:CubicO group peptidase (beta-lactamase class C family)
MSLGGFSQTRLARVESALSSYVERGEVPGVAALVRRRGETHVFVRGNQAVGGAPMGRGTIVRISSMTKPIGAVAAMVLVEEGKLRLDEPVDRLLPELANRRVLARLDAALDDTVPSERPITVRDLLTFRMGFGQLMAPPNAYPILQAANDLQIGMGPPNPQRMPEPEEWIRRLGTLPLMFQPGERWLYNTGLDVLGVLIARASGQSLDVFLRERIFEPLGMPDTSFGVPTAKLDRLAESYWTNPWTGKMDVFDPVEGGQWSQPPRFPSAAAGLVSTVDDYLAFSQMLLDGGRAASTRILSRPAVELLTDDQLTPAQKANSGLVPDFFDSHGWGFGVAVVTRRVDLAGSVGSYGWDGGLGTGWLSDPREQLVTLLMTQVAWSSPSPPPILVDFRNLAYQAIDD